MSNRHGGGTARRTATVHSNDAKSAGGPAGRCAAAAERFLARELSRAALIGLPLKGVEVAFGYRRLLRGQGAVPETGDPLPQARR